MLSDSFVLILWVWIPVNHRTTERTKNVWERLIEWQTKEREKEREMDTWRVWRDNSKSVWILCIKAYLFLGLILIYEWLYHSFQLMSAFSIWCRVGKIRSADAGGERKGAREWERVGALFVLLFVFVCFPWPYLLHPVFAVWKKGELITLIMASMLMTLIQLWKKLQIGSSLITASSEPSSPDSH